MGCRVMTGLKRFFTESGIEKKGVQRQFSYRCEGFSGISIFSSNEINMEKTINWGIIGCGDVCEVKSGPAFNKVPGSRLVAVMRRDAAGAKDFADRHGVPKSYDNAQALINDEEVNAIYIATPPSSHEQYLEAALKAGKPAYVEKPVTIDVASCERMIAWEKKYGVKVSVAHYRRSLDFFIKIKELVTTAAIGKVKLVLLKMLQPVSNKIITQTKDNWRVNPAISGGGLFHDLSPHQLDILYWIFGDPGEPMITATNQGGHYDAPDNVLLHFTFPGNIGFNGTWNFNVGDAATADQCEIIGDAGIIRFAFFRQGTIEVITSNSTETFSYDFPIHIQLPHIEKVVSYFRNEGPNPCSLQEALSTLRIIEKAR